MLRTLRMTFSKPYTIHEWRVAVTLLIFYTAASVASSFLIPAPALLYPATAIALAGLFFGGPRLWPVVAVAAMLSGLIVGMPLVPLLYRVFAEVLQAFVGAFLLRGMRIDPLFRSSRDMFTLLVTVAFISLMAPTIIAVLYVAHYGLAYTPTEWSYAYAANLFSLLVLTPFLLRWFAKPRFNRPLGEVIETTCALFLLSGISYLLFIRDMETLFGLPIRI